MAFFRLHPDDGKIFAHCELYGHGESRSADLLSDLHLAKHAEPPGLSAIQQITHVWELAVRVFEDCRAASYASRLCNRADKQHCGQRPNPISARYVVGQSQQYFQLWR